MEASIDFYNEWFLRFAPATYRKQRVLRTKEVIESFEKTANLTRITPEVLKENPSVLSMLRMATAPPLARDRLMGLAYVNKSLIESMEGKKDKLPRLPSKMTKTDLDEELRRICDVISELADRDLFAWLDSKHRPKPAALERAAAVVADRLCGAASDPIIRNAQEKRQLDALKRWLKKRKYSLISTDAARNPNEMPPGTFTFRLVLPAGKKATSVNIPIDCVIKPSSFDRKAMPVLIEAKSAGDAANTNKRRKEEAQKYTQLKERYGSDVLFVLLLCGYFEPGYLGYEASEGIDWIWEHRLDDLDQLLSGEDRKKVSTIEQVNEPGATFGDAAETGRLASQQQIDDSKSTAERNILGQFSTPYHLALEIVTNALTHLPEEHPIAFIEPGLGTGVFFSALRRSADGRTLKEAIGVELDPAYAEVARKIWSQYGLMVEQTDFISFSASSRQANRYNLLCTNPPYVRHHHISPDVKRNLQSRISRELGITISGLAGLYVYFILLAHAMLAEGAIASWLIPSEFLYVNYGKVLRDYLRSHVTLLNIHQFDPEEVQFDDALVSSCLVTYLRRSPSPNAAFRFSFGADMSFPKHSQEVPLDNGLLNGKWTMLHLTDEEGRPEEEYKVGDFFTVKRGLATGANEFFIVDKPVIDQYSIPAQFIKPILPSARYLLDSVIQSDTDGSPRIDKVRYLLDCDVPPEIVKKQHPGLWNYFQKGVEKGIPERYLCAGREIWYYQERRAASPFLATYIGRSQNGTKSPVRFILNLSNALVTNVYLNLYPNEILSSLLREDKTRFVEILKLLNEIPTEDVLRAGRSYGGGLHKIEPKELLNVPLRNVPEWLKISTTKQLVML
ncbi:MAG: XamI family restriction endonuclease [Nitrospiraceae bacterium]|nr:XamI family restriction endonuclease [Nitrospiraceae bacterium]